MNLTSLKKQIESIESPGVPEKIRGMSVAKTHRGWLLGRINVFRKRNNKDVEMVLLGVLDSYNHFHPKTAGRIQIEPWKGHSSITLIKRPDKIIIAKWQKPHKGSKPKEVRIEVSKEELNFVIEAINFYDYKTEIETWEIAKRYCYSLGLSSNHHGHPLWEEGEFVWDNFFCWRSLHNRLTKILDALDFECCIEYNGGKTKILKKDFSIQSIL